MALARIRKEKSLWMCSTAFSIKRSIFQEKIFYQRLSPKSWRKGLFFIPPPFSEYGWPKERRDNWQKVLKITVLLHRTTKRLTLNYKIVKYFLSPITLPPPYNSNGLQPKELQGAEFIPGVVLRKTQQQQGRQKITLEEPEDFGILSYRKYY